MEIAYGHRVENDDDQYLEITETVNEAVAGSGDAGVSIVDFFPICMLVYIVSWDVTNGVSSKASTRLASGNRDSAALQTYVPGSIVVKIADSRRLL